MASRAARLVSTTSTGGVPGLANHVDILLCASAIFSAATFIASIIAAATSSSTVCRTPSAAASNRCLASSMASDAAWSSGVSHQFTFHESLPALAFAFFAKVSYASLLASSSAKAIRNSAQTSAAAAPASACSSSPQANARFRNLLAVLFAGKRVRPVCPVGSIDDSLSCADGSRHLMRFPGGRPSTLVGHIQVTRAILSTRYVAIWRSRTSPESRCVSRYVISASPELLP